MTPSSQKRNKSLCIIQARMGSSRLPGKVLKKVNNITLLEYEILRIKQSKKIEKIVVATTTKKKDEQIEKLCKKIKVDCFRGSEDDVLDRYYQCSLRYPEFNTIIRLTGDCPLIDPLVIDETVSFFNKNNFSYANNRKFKNETFPGGIVVEIFKKKILAKAVQNAQLMSEREHVTLWMVNNKKIKKGTLRAPHDFSHIRLTVDHPEDFEVVKFLIKKSPLNAPYLYYVSLLTKHPNIMQKNMHIEKEEGLTKSLKNDYKII